MLNRQRYRYDQNVDVPVRPAQAEQIHSRCLVTRSSAPDSRRITTQIDWALPAVHVV